MKFKSLLSIALMAALAGDLFAQEADSNRRAEVRERWEALSEEERVVYVERMERLRNMKPEEREALEQRAGEIELRKEKQYKTLPKEFKRRVEAMPEREREHVLRRYFDECERVRGLRMREQLPPEFLERLESGPPEERRSMMREFKHEMRDHAAERMLDHMRGELGVAPEVIETVIELPVNERRQAMLEIKREHIRGRVKSSGVPPDVTDEEWRELDALPLKEFFGQWGLQRDDERRGPRGGPGFPDHPPRGERGPGFEPGQPPIGGRSGRQSREDRKLQELVHPSFEDMLETSRLPRSERREAVSKRVRKRCQKYLDENPVLEPEDLERLRGLRDQEFIDELRHGLGRPPERRWVRPPERDRPERDRPERERRGRSPRERKRR